MPNKRHSHHKPPQGQGLPRFHPGSTKKGSNYRRIIAQGQTSLREYSLHATKGYRSRSLVGVEQ